VGTDYGILWTGWAFLEGSWVCLAGAEDIGSCHRRLLAATAGMGLRSGDRYLVLGGHSPAPQRPQDTLTAAAAAGKPAGDPDAL
jgi:hypothetical protein